MAVKFTNNAVTTLTAGISAGVTQFNVASNSGFPSLSGADHTYVTIGVEVIKVTAISGATFTCIATSSAHANGDNVELRMTAELLDDFATDLEAMPKTGGTFTGNVSLNDNVILGLGNDSSSGSDLILYHDGSNAYINTSTGALRLSSATAGSSVQILGSGETLAEFTDDGDVDLFHNGVLKFSTTATGINVVGNLALSGTVDGVDIQTLNSAVSANTAKTGITSSQTSAITANTAKVGITSAQATAISNNTAKTGITSGQAAAIVLNTAKTGITSGQASAITANTAKTGITSSQTNAIVANTAKTGITSGQASAITANTAKTGITSGQASAITANTSKTTNATHTGDVTGATALTIGTSKVLTAMIADDAVTADKLANSINTSIATNTAKTGITSGQTSAITANTAKVGITSAQASAITANTAKVTNSTSASDLSSGTLPMARLSGTLPALNGSNLTNLPAGSDSTKLPLAGGTMTGDLILGDNVKLEVGNTTGGDLQIYHDGSNSYIVDDGTGDLILRGTSNVRIQNGTGESMFTGQSDGSVYIYHNNSTKLHTTATGVTVTGALVVSGTVDGIDIASRDAVLTSTTTTAGNALPKAGGTMTGDLDVQANITADQLIMGDNQKIKLGNANDLEIYHNGSASYITDVGEGNLLLSTNGTAVILQTSQGEKMVEGVKDGAVNLYHNNVKKIETTSAGATVTGALAVTGTVDGVDIASRDAVLTSTTTTAGNALPKAGGTMTGNTLHGDGVASRYGASDDLRIFHDGTHSYIDDAGTGDLRLRGTGLSLRSFDTNEPYLNAAENGAVTLYYDNAAKFETTSAGVNVTGLVDCDGTSMNDGAVAYYGNNADLRIYHDGTNSYIDDTGTGDLIIRASDDVHIQKYTGETMINCNVDGAVDLYHDNALKFSTASYGATVTGTLVATEVSANLTKANSVDSAQYVDGSIDTAHLGNLQVTGAKLALDGRSANATDDVYSGNQNDFIFYDASDGLRFYTANAEDMRLTDGGDLHVDGNVIAYSSTISDERLKHDIEPITDALSKVNQLNGCTFTYNADGKKSAGLIAQDVEKVLPSAVSESKLPLKVDDDKEYKVLQYDQTIGLLVEAIKELTAKVEELENK